MSPDTCILVTIIGCLLLMKGSHAGEKLNKPELEVLSSDPNDVVMIGDTVTFFCINVTNVQKFFLMKADVTIQEQASSTFVLNGVSKNDSGLYSCSYSLNSQQSELSDPVYVYVKDTYPPPTLTVKPWNNVQPREGITITCHAPYTNMIFTIYKDGDVLEKSSGNPFSYVIRTTRDIDNGKYVCNFRTKDNSMMSDFSDPVVIQVKELPSPSVYWEVSADDKETLKITCRAPVKYKQMWFQLLNSSKDVEDEKQDTDQSTVQFAIPISNSSQKTYYCMYSIRIHYNFARSVISSPINLWEDYTTTNVIRMLLSALVLIVLGVILVKHFSLFQKTYKPEVPAYRKTPAAESEYSEMVIMNTNVADTVDAPSLNCEISSVNKKMEEK